MDQRSPDGPLELQILVLLSYTEVVVAALVECSSCDQGVMSSILGKGVITEWRVSFNMHFLPATDDSAVNE